MFCRKCGARIGDAEELCIACRAKTQENISSAQSATALQSIQRAAILAISIKLSVAFGVISTIKGVLVRGVPSGLTGIGYILLAIALFTLLALLPIRYYIKKAYPLYTSIPVAMQKQVKVVGIVAGVIVALAFNVIWIQLIYPEIIGMAAGCLTSYIVMKNKK